MKKLLTILLSVLMILTLGIVNVAAEENEEVDPYTIEESTDLSANEFACPPEVDIDHIGYRVVKAKAPAKEYTGKDNPADVNFYLLKSGWKVNGLKKVDLHDLMEDLKKCKNLFDVIIALTDEYHEDWNADYMVVYTQNGKVVEPKKAGTYTATVIFRPLTARFDCSFLANDCGVWHLSRYANIPYTINPAEYANEGDSAYLEDGIVAPKAKDLTANGSQQVLAEAGKATVKDGDKTAELPMEYSLDGENWTSDINKLTGKASGTYKLYYRINHPKAANYNSNFQTYGADGSLFIEVTIKPTPVRPYTPVVTGF